MLPVEQIVLHGLPAGLGVLLIALSVYDQYRDLRSAIARRRELSAEFE